MNVCPCGAKVKANAAQCPQCGAQLLSRFTRMFACQKCGERLVRSDHLLRGYRSPVQDGGSKMSGFFHQRPCINCNEPRPFPERRLVRERQMRRAMITAAILASLAWILRAVTS